MTHKKTVHKDQVKIWRPQMAKIWCNYFPPARPLTSELNIFAKYISNQKRSEGKPKLLVLGATPEIRDIGFEYNCDVYCIETNKRNFEILTKLRRFISNETLLLADWRNPRTQELFDLIIGDTAISLLPPMYWSEILDSLALRLRPNGLFVHRFLAWQKEDFEHIGIFDEKEFSRLLQEIRDEHKDFYPSVIHYLYRAFTRPDGSVSCREWLNKIQEEHSKGVVTDEEFTSVKYLLYQAEKEDFKIFIPPKSQVDEILGRRFEVKAIDQGDAFFSFTKCALIYAAGIK